MDDAVIMPGPLDGQHDVTTDLACKHCGYNLRGLHKSGNCPECNTPIDVSLRGDLLRFADPVWVATVAKGLTIILWMLLVWLMASIASGVLSAFVSPVLAQAVLLVAQCGSVYGVWLMTERDPSGIGEDPNVTARKIVRFAVIVGAVSQLLLLIDEGLAFGGVLSILWAFTLVACGIVSLVGEFAKFIFYAQLAMRIPEPALVKRANFLKWAFTVTFGLMMVLGIVVGALSAAAAGAGAGPGTGPPMALAGVACLMAPVGLAMFVFGIMAIFLLFSLRKHVKLNAEYARDNWNKME